MLLVDAIKIAHDTLPCQQTSEIMDTARHHQKRATAYSTAIAKRLIDNSACGHGTTSDAACKPAFFEHHGNTQLIVLAFSKAIEHTIDYHLSTDTRLATGSPSQHTQSSSAEWVSSVKPLLICLTTLDQSNSGRRLASPALRDLVRRHGDILLECWTPEASGI